MRSVFLAAATFLATPSNAATVLFSENFDSITTNTLGITTTVANMDVVGNVDAVVPVNPFGITVSSTVIDLDGSTGPGGVGKSGFNLLAGRRYTLSAVVGGAQRASGNEILYVSFTSSANGDLKFLSSSGLFSFGQLGNLATTFYGVTGVAGSAPFDVSNLTFFANRNTNFAFELGTTSRDGIGPLLDSVVLTANHVPEPASWALLITGFGLAGAISRRRRAALARSESR